MQPLDLCSPELMKSRKEYYVPIAFMYYSHGHNMRYAIVLLLFCFFTIPTFAQGTNNPFPFDSTDVKNSLELLGMQCYKFPVVVQQAKKYRLNYIIERTVNEKTIEVMNIVKGLKQGLPKGLSLKNLPVDVIVPPLDSGMTYLRTYVQHSKETTVSLTYSSQYSKQTVDIDIDTSKFEKSHSRAFTYKGIKLGERVPLVVFYMNAKGSPFLFCPGPLLPPDIIKRYPFVLVMYAELIDEI